MTNQKFGWAGETEANRAWDEIGDQFQVFGIKGVTESKAGGTYRLWKFVREVLGKDTPNYAQQTGDCVSMGAQNAVEHVACVEISNGESELFKRAFAPYLYYTSRVLIGKNQLRGRAGSVGSWMAKAVEQYGVVPVDAEELPPYSGELADRWGDGNGSPEQWLDVGASHLITTTSRVNNWSELVEAIGNGYPVTIASNLGFNMKPSSDGYHRRKGSWAHQMCIVGVCDGSKPWAAIRNSWGKDAHGQLTDFETGDAWPLGTLRVRPEDLEPAFRSGELYAFSQFEGFPEQNLSWDFM